MSLPDVTSTVLPIQPAAVRRSASAMLRLTVLLVVAFGCAPRFAAQGANAPGAANRSAAIYRDTVPAGAGAASPDQLAAILRDAHWTTTFLKSEQLADPEELQRARYTVLVLPYGPSFPVAAADTFRRFLHAGGKLFTTGGYAFDDLLERSPSGWRAYQPPAPARLDGAAWFCDLPASTLRGRGPLTFRGWLKAAGVAGPGFAHFSVYQIAADGSLPTWRDLCQVRGTADWTEHTFVFDVHPHAVTVSLRAGLYRCRGQAWFDDVRLTDARAEPLAGTGFETAFDPDAAVPGNWWRSHRELCELQHSVVHSGSNALGARLEFELPRIERLNTRHGRPEDGLEVEPTQLGIFQADYPLERVHGASAAAGQTVVSPDFRVEGPLTGWAACGVVGSDTARWIPLVTAQDAYGRPRGAVGALLRHHAGEWAGSSWAFFGVTNRDLWGHPGATREFTRILDALACDTYFPSLLAEPACVRQGEEVRIVASVFNGSANDREVRIELAIYPGEYRAGAAAATNFVFAFTARSGPSNAVVARWQPARYAAPFYHLVAELREGTHAIDRIESGFVVRDASTIARGPQLKFRNNYLHFGERPLFLFGTDDWGYVFNAARETPLQWRRDMAQRRDLGVLIYENLQWGLPPSWAAAEPLWRKADGVIQLAQEFGQVYFAGLLIGCNAAAGEADLARQRAYCRSFAQRYAEVPGLIYYLNGDYRCELSSAVTPQWNAFLQERYPGGTAELRKAWDRFAPAQPLGQIPAEEYRDWEQTWDDVSAYDRNGFRAWLMRRWNSALIAGIHEVDRAHPTSGEFYQLPHSGVDLPAGIDGLDLANFGFFEKRGADLVKFPALCVYNDQRARGKSGGPGEYGVKTHPAWGDGRDYGYHTARTREEALDLFLAIPHCALGLGASRIHNWCWKDDAHRVFPWGMVYPCDGVPKDVAYVHRNISLLFRLLAPVDQPPAVCLLTPDTHRLGGAKWKVIDGVLAGIDLALSAHIENLGTLNELGLEIPAAARALFYPLPFCIPDRVYAQLVTWVRKGGVLYLSGDLSFDELRRRSHPERLEELCGVRFVAERYPHLSVQATNAADQPCVRVEPGAGEVLQALPDGTPVLVHHRLGRGEVFYAADPIELHSTPDRRSRDVALYRRVLAAANVPPTALDPDDPETRVFRVALRDGGEARIVFCADPTRRVRPVTVGTSRGPIQLAVQGQRPALVWLNGAGAIRAIEAQGECRIGTDLVLRDDTGGAVLTLDGQDLAQSRAVLLMPLRRGEVRWARTAAATDLVMDTGGFEGGVWKSYAVQAPPGAGRVNITAEQEFSLVLVCEREALPRWRRFLERAITDPGSLP